MLILITVNFQHLRIYSCYKILVQALTQIHKANPANHVKKLKHGAQEQDSTLLQLMKVTSPKYNKITQVCISLELFS